jgi:hypothetical protein
MIPSKIEQSFLAGIIKIALLIVMSIVFTVQSCMSQSIPKGDEIASKIASWEDSMRRLKPRNRPVYAGLDVSMGGPSYRIKSNIDALNNLPVNYFGGMAGGVLANPIGKIKSGIGIYYSGDNVPHLFDLLAANLSINLYPLRIKKVVYHTFEPYVLAGISQMKNKFYGYYLPDALAKLNRSFSEDPYVGSVMTTHLLIGMGVEYQLENNHNDFIHLYTEVSLGRNVRTIATRDELSHSVVPTSLWITVGISFGKFK